MGQCIGKVLCDTRESEVSSNIEESDTGEFERSGTEEFEGCNTEEFEECNTEESKGISNKAEILSFYL
ncbi:unnamed protein product [Rhizophagus irregularis]|uniref:Uncharacterized protein n=1 Tax=Rhizophagus irregularis TaxID=588596 RepID=A0A2I1HN43_9GLOM|nr:hypothetical protein RhiirA4_483719 [Rhizophagus irregularis]CAB4426695.1 unnamed protein product [Rhizophagus irregularis]